MKKVKSIILGALLAGSLTQISAEDTVDDQIAEIQKAPAAQRVQLMNQFKKNLANMNEEDQIKAMTRMRERIQVRNQTRTADAASENAKETQKRVNQMNQMQQMHQNMGQIQNVNMSSAMQGGKR